MEELVKTLKDSLKDLGYNDKEILKMTKTFPEIYGFSIENIKPKIEFYDSINLHCIISKRPAILMQSVALSYARYMFYKDKGIKINESNNNKLFIRQKLFKEQ